MRKRLQWHGTCQGQNLKDGHNLLESDLGFTYVPASSPNDTHDFTSKSTWVNSIIRQANKALSAAFTGVPVIEPKEAAPLGFFNHGTPDHVVNIVGDPTPPAGEGRYTIPAHLACQDFGILCRWSGVVYYTAEMNAAQGGKLALYSPVYPPKTPTQKLAFQELLSAIAIGIGNAAAHELGHQFQLPDMDCNGVGPTCPSPTGPTLDPGLFYEFHQQPAQWYLDIGYPLQWDSNDAKKSYQQLFKK